MAGWRPTKYEWEITLNKVQEYLEWCVDTYEEIPVQNMVTTKDLPQGETLNEKKVTTRYRLKVGLPTIEGLCEYLNVRKATIYTWEQNYSEFLNHTNELREKQAQKLMQNSISWDYNPAIAKVLLSGHGYNERIVNENNNKNEDVTWNQNDLLNDISE